MSCEQVQPVLAVLALGGPQSEVADDGVAEHLSGCALCRSVQEDFSGTAAVLSRVELYEVVGIPVPDPERAIALVRRRSLPSFWPVVCLAWVREAASPSLLMRRSGPDERMYSRGSSGLVPGHLKAGGWPGLQGSAEEA